MTDGEATGEWNDMWVASCVPNGEGGSWGGAVPFLAGGAELGPGNGDARDDAKGADDVSLVLEIQKSAG